MSRLFLTNIDLNTNELQNAVIQNLSSAPLSGNKEGRVYYDVTNKALYLYTDGQWKPLASGGAAASSIELKGDVTGTANVDPATGKLTVQTTVDSSFVTLNGTQSLQNKTFAGDTYFQSAGGAGGNNNYLSVNNSTGVLTVNSGYGLNLTSTNDVTITSNSADIVLNPDGYVYYGSKTPGHKVATIDDLTNVTLNIQGTENQITVNDNAGVSTISLPSYIDVPEGELHLAKTEYWQNGNQQGVIVAHPFDGSLSIAAINQLVLESHDGNIRVNPSNGWVNIGGNLYLQTNGRISTENTDLLLEPDSGNVVIGNRLVTDQIVSKNGAGDVLTVTSNELYLSNDYTIIGGNQADSNGRLYVKNISGLNALAIDTTDSAADLSYHGYNNYTSDTPVIKLNGFIELSSEGNATAGHIFVNSHASTTPFPTFHVEANGDLALRAGAGGNNGNIILYTGETSGNGTGRVYIGWNQSNGSDNWQNEVATVGTHQNISNKTIVGTLKFNDGASNSTIYAVGNDLVINANTNLNLNTNNGDINLSPDSGNVVINNTLITDNITSKNGGNDSLYISGGYSNIHLDSSNGNIEINPDGIVYVNGGANFANDVNIAGNLNVQGTLNAINRTEINIEDNTIRLNTGFTGSPTADAGIIVERGTANDTAIIWNESNDQWTLSNDGNNYYAIARKYVEVIGDASNTSFDVIHNLGTRDITVMVRENNAEYNVVETDVLMKDNNTVTIGFTDAPALNSYRVIIVG